MAVRTRLMAAVIIAGSLVAACGVSDEGPAATAEETAPQSSSAPLEPTRFEFARGEPFRVDALLPPPPLGEPPLSGKVVLKILSVETG